MKDITYYSWTNNGTVVYTTTLTPTVSSVVYDVLLNKTDLSITSVTENQLAYIIIFGLERNWQRDSEADQTINNFNYYGWKNGVRVYYTMSETPSANDPIYDTPTQISALRVQSFTPRILPTITIDGTVYTLDETQYQNPPDLIDPWRLALKYNQSPRIRKLYDGLGDIVARHSMWNFYKFFDVDQARGVWLDKLGELYNYKRPFGLTGSVFVLDIDRLDDVTIVMDGFTAELVDEFYRALLKLRQSGNFTMLSFDTIENVFKTVFGDDNVEVEVEEGYMSFTIYLTLVDPMDVKILYTILEMEPEILGVFPGISYTIIPQLRGL